MKKILIIVFVFSLRSGFAQGNLISNYSFENHSSCPTFLGQLNYASNWFQTFSSSTVELFDTCSTDIQTQVPNNYFGFQYPKTGNAYCGIVTFYAPFKYREFAENKLINPLVKDIKYCFSFNVSYADFVQYTNNNIGLAFSDTFIYYSGSPTIYNLGIVPIFENAVKILNDSINWIQLSGEYMAHGGEQYLIIGNFRNDENSDTTRIRSIGDPSAYYYIDDVSLVYCGEDTIPPEPIENSMNVVSAFTPNGDGVNDLYYVKGTNISSVHLKIINRWGQLLYEATGENSGWDGKYDGNDVSPGVYYYIIEVTFIDGEVRNKAGSIQLIR